MRRRSILAFLALAGGLTGSSFAQTLHSIGGGQPSDLTDNGLSFIGTQSVSSPCTSGTSVFRITFGSPITFGTLGAGQSNIAKASGDGTVAVGTVANGTSIVLNPVSTTATIANLSTGGASWAALANARYPTDSAAADQPVNDNCSGATPVTVTPGAVAGSTISSTAYTLDDVTTDPAFSTIVNCVGDSLSTSTVTSRDLFYTFTPPCSGTYTIQTCGSTQFAPILHVFSSCSETAILA